MYVIVNLLFTLEFTFFQLLQFGCFRCCALKALFTSSTHISTTELPNILPKMVSTIFTTGSMNWLGILWAESSAVISCLQHSFIRFHFKLWIHFKHISIGTIYPGLMVTSAMLYHISRLVNITIDIRNICVFLAPLFSSFTTIVTYLLTKELKVKNCFLLTYLKCVRIMYLFNYDSIVNCRIQAPV